jgi:flagellar hook-basal body complex protein FliE
MQLPSSLAAQSYVANRSATAPGANLSASAFSANLANDFATTLRQSDQIALDAMTGGADPHTLVQSLAQTELAVETAVTVRNKVVEAYQEILRMPV